MVELGMVRRMVARGAILAPVVAATLWLLVDARWAFSAAVGIALALGNLWLAARVIGGVAENNPQLVMAAGLIVFALGLAILTGIAFALKATDLVFFPVTGLSLIGAHLVLVLWEAAGAYARIESHDTKPITGEAANQRS